MLNTSLGTIVFSLKTFDYIVWLGFDLKTLIRTSVICLTNTEVLLSTLGACCPRPGSRATWLFYWQAKRPRVQAKGWGYNIFT